MTNRYREREPIWWKRLLLAAVSYVVDLADYSAGVRTPDYPRKRRVTRL